MTHVRLPRLLDQHQNELRRLHPLRLSITQNLAPLSTATMELPAGEGIGMRQLVELFTLHGSAGIYRVTALQSGNGQAQRVTLSHGLCTLSDAMIAGEGQASGPARQLLGSILQTQDRWVLGTVDVPDDVLLTWKWNNSNALEALINLMSELPDYYLDVDQSALPWQLHVLRLPTEEGCACSLSRGLTGINIREDDSELCTVLHVPGLDAPLQADTIGTWGPVSRQLTADSSLTGELLLTAARAYLEQYKNPKLTITIDAIELAHRTGDAFDRFRCGTICRTALEGYPGPIRQRIVYLQYPDVIGAPDVCKLTLADTARTASAAIAGLVVDTTVLHQRVVYQSQVIQDKADKTTLENLQAELAEIKSAWADYFYTLTLGADEALIETLNAGDINAAGVEASQITVDGAPVATRKWVTGTALTPYATQAWCMGKFQTKE